MLSSFECTGIEVQYILARLVTLCRLEPEFVKTNGKVVLVSRVVLVFFPLCLPHHGLTVSCSSVLVSAEHPEDARSCSVPGCHQASRGLPWPTTSGREVLLKHSYSLHRRSDQCTRLSLGGSKMRFYTGLHMSKNNLCSIGHGLGNIFHLEYSTSSCLLIKSRKFSKDNLTFCF